MVTGAAPQEEITPDVVRRHLLRILSSEAFQGSHRSANLLETLIEARLENRMDDLKEHRLAQFFFPDLAGFKSSSVYKMRGVFKRLKLRLNTYYRTDGKFDDIIIVFRHSLYVPEFTLRSGKTVLPPPAPAAHPVAHPVPAPVPQPVPLEPAAMTEAAEAPAAEGVTGETEEAALEPPPPVAPKPGSRRRRRRRSSTGSTSSSSLETFVKPKTKSRTTKGYGWAIAAAVVAVPLVAGLGLLLTSRTEVLASLPDLTEAVRLTADDELAVDPILSTSGRHLAYASDKESNGALNIWVMDLNEPGRHARRVTRGEHEDNQPTISPDGQTIIYHSSRDGGGIWSVPASGGTPKLLAAGGRRPRLSPDGRQVAYWTRSQQGMNTESRLYVMDATGGTPRQLAKDFLNAEQPVWSPDGRHILFLGRPIPPAPKRVEDEIVLEPMDWWVTTPEDSAPTRTGSLPTGVSDILFGPPGVWTQYANRILADSMQQGSRQPIAVAMDPTYKRMGGTENIVTAGIANGQPYLANGRLVSSRIDIMSQIASIPIDGEGSATGALQVLSTESSGNEFLPTMNAAGTAVAYVSERKGSFNAFTKLLASGKEERLSNIPQGWSPTYSRDGRLLAVLYPTIGAAGTGAGTGGIEIHTNSTVSTPLPCDRCERLVAISNDGQRIIYTARNPRNPVWIGIYNVATRQHSTILGHPNVVTDADWSPNEKWIVFGNRLPGQGTQIMISSFAGMEAGRPTPLTSGKSNDDKPRFSPDGRLLFFLSDRDQNICLYAVGFDPAAGKVVGEPRAVQHFHQKKLSTDSVPPPVQVLSVSQHRVALTVQRTRSAVFYSEPR